MPIFGRRNQHDVLLACFGVSEAGVPVTGKVIVLDPLLTGHLITMGELRGRSWPNSGESTKATPLPLNVAGEILLVMAIKSPGQGPKILTTMIPCLLSEADSLRGYCADTVVA